MLMVRSGHCSEGTFQLTPDGDGHYTLKIFSEGLMVKCHEDLSLERANRIIDNSLILGTDNDDDFEIL